MKVMECCRCHHLFKTSEDHIVYYSKDGNMNYCKECSDKLLTLVGAGMDLLLQLHEDGINPFKPVNLRKQYAKKTFS